ncbi:MAG: hypothetical protein RL095_3851 [Verrucomicrobiota bacterium]|jgi:integrase
MAKIPNPDPKTLAPKKGRVKGKFKYGEGSLYRRENGVYYYKVFINGEELRRSTGCTDRKQAEKWVVDSRIPELRSGKIEKLNETIREMRLKAQPVTFDDAYRLYMTGKTVATAEKYDRRVKSLWDDFAAWATQERNYASVSSVTKQDAEAYINHVKAGTRDVRAGVKAKTKKDPLSGTSVNAYIQNLGMVFGYSMEKACLTVNPFEKVPKLKRTKSQRRDAFEREEITKIIEAVKAPEHEDTLRPLVFVGLYTGLRKGDICTLLWSDIKFESEAIFRTMNKTKRVVQIPILPPLMSYLKALPRRGSFVFPVLAANYKRSASISTPFAQLLERLKIDRYRTVPGRSRKFVCKDLHSLRHSFVWNAADHKVPLAIIQEIVGHMDAEMTMRYARHANLDATRRHLENMPDLLGDSSGKKKVKYEKISSSVEQPVGVGEYLETLKKLPADQIEYLARMLANHIGGS